MPDQNQNQPPEKKKMSLADAVMAGRTPDTPPTPPQNPEEFGPPPVIPVDKNFRAEYLLDPNFSNLTPQQIADKVNREDHQKNPSPTTSLPSPENLDEKNMTEILAVNQDPPPQSNTSTPESLASQDPLQSPEKLEANAVEWRELMQEISEKDGIPLGEYGTESKFRGEEDSPSNPNPPDDPNLRRFIEYMQNNRLLADELEQVIGSLFGVPGGLPPIGQWAGEFDVQRILPVMLAWVRKADHIRSMWPAIKIVLGNEHTDVNWASKVLIHLTFYEFVLGLRD